MSRSPLEYLRHTVDEMAFLMDRSQGLDKDSFLRDATLKRAFVRSLEIIGEAVKNVPDDFRHKYGHIALAKPANPQSPIHHHKSQQEVAT